MIDWFGDLDVPFQWKLRFDEERQRKEQHHQIGRNVEDGVRDQMMVVRCTLRYSGRGQDVSPLFVSETWDS